MSTLPTSSILTPRLILRSLLPSDAPTIFTLRTLPEIQEDMVSSPFTNAAEAVRWIEASAARPGSHYHGIRLRNDRSQVQAGVTEHKAQDEIIGMLGINEFGAVFYLLHPSLWGRGLVPEAVQAFVMKILEWEPERDRVEGWILEGNEKSAKVLMKCGFVYDDEKTQAVRDMLKKEEEEADKNMTADKVGEAIGAGSKKSRRADFVRKPIGYRFLRPNT